MQLAECVGCEWWSLARSSRPSWPPVVRTSASSHWRAWCGRGRVGVIRSGSEALAALLQDEPLVPECASVCMHRYLPFPRGVSLLANCLLPAPTLKGFLLGSRRARCHCQAPLCALLDLNLARRSRLPHHLISDLMAAQRNS